MPNIRFDPDLGQYVAETPTGEVYADTHSECMRKLADALRVATKHLKENEREGADDAVR